MDTVLGLIPSSLERSDEIKQIIILVTEFSSDNDYILDEHMDMKRLRIILFEKEADIMLEYFLDRCKVGAAQKKEESSEGNWASQSKAKMKERKILMGCKERLNGTQGREKARDIVDQHHQSPQIYRQLDCRQSLESKGEQAD